MNARTRFATLILWILPVPAIHAQNAPVAVDEPPVAEDELDRSTPRLSVENFMRAIEAGDYELAAHFLDLRDLPPRYRDVQPGELARQLGVVFSREVWINPAQLSNEPAGWRGDDLPVSQDELATLQAESGAIVLLLQRVESEDTVPVWKIANTTVARTADLYEVFGYGPLVEFVAAKVPDISILGLELFKWVLTVAAGVMIYALLLLVSWLLSRAWTIHDTVTKERFFRFLAGPVALVATAFAMRFVVYELGLGITARRIAEGRTLVILLMTWLLLATASLVRDGLLVSLERRGRQGAVVLQRPLFAALKIVVVLTALLTWLDNIGYNITTLLASLGVGGIAVALALQKPLEDVFGAFTLYNQQPVRVGDFCRFGNQLGLIENIGLRTTRIRTLSNSVISVPNAKIAGEYLENYSVRQKMLYNPTIRLRYDTPAEQLRRALDGIREMLADHERVIQENPRVRFTAIAPDALEVQIFAYLNTTAWPEYLEIVEGLNFRVLEAVSAAGARLSLPAQSLLLEGSVPETREREGG